MILRVLGSAAGGGVPQWNCGCRNCAAARAGTQPRRMQSCAAVSADGDRWLLLNCSPDIAAQIESFPPLQPRGVRDTPVDGMLLTDANVDHAYGFAALRQKGSHRFIVRSSPAVREIAERQPALEPFTRAPHLWSPVDCDGACTPLDARDVVGRDIEVRAIDVRGKTPGYDGRRDVRGAVYAYTLRQRGGGTLLFAPVFAAFGDALRAALREADVALLDGSFFTDDELRAEGLMPKSARHLGHLPVSGPDGSLEELRATNARVIFTHLNNSNPMLDPDSAAAAAVRAAGAEIAYDGMQLEI